jgi:hypothetical protein
MTTENTTDTTVTLTAAQKADKFVLSNFSADIIAELTRCYEKEEAFKNEIEYAEKARNDFRTRWAVMSDTIEQFLKTHISEGDSASVEELKELAEELDIELTKEITVTFTVEVEAKFTVPVDFDQDTISEDDFNIDVEFNSHIDDVECDEVDCNVNDFSVEEN